MQALKRLHLLAIGLAAIGWLTCVPAASAATVQVHATMILASNDPSAQDPRLENIEFKLRRMFRFEYYRFYGEGTAVVTAPGGSSIDLGHGFRIELQSSGTHDGKVRASVQWYRGDEVVLNTTVGMKPGNPVILGGIQHEGGTLIVTLVAE